MVGWFAQLGFGGLNSVLLALLFLTLKSKFREMDRKIDILWDWHLLQRGKQAVRSARKEVDDDE